MADGDIDLYADVEGDFANEDFSANDSRDLYDDVITKEEKPSAGGPRSDPISPTTPVGSTTLMTTHKTNEKRYMLYIGNLTWWTTDNDITEAILNAGVNDFQEVKFHENRINGQSKGFCFVTLGSEASMKIVMEKIPKIELHGQVPVVTHATRTALQQFEAQSKTRAEPPPQQQNKQQQQLPAGLPRTSVPPPTAVGRGYAPPTTRPPFVRGPPPMISGPPPIIHHPPPLTSALPPPMMSHVAPPPLMTTLPPRGPPPMIQPAGPAPHVNPAFFAQAPPPGYPPAMHHGLSEAEFEEIMNRNRTVSSSAIARAVQDAANNEYSSAIETLVTAISLIKQSKVANDDRCKILVASLQDTLSGIENKSYSSRRERSRSRDRERAYRSSHRSDYSRERDYRPREYRERSRERERDYYRDREREYYEERQRYKERERMERERDREAGGGGGSGRGRSGEEMDRERERVDIRDKERERPRH